MAIQSTYHGKSVEVVGIAMDRDGAATVREFLARHRTNYRIAYGDEALAEKFGGAQILPITLFIDRDGLIAARALGYRASAPLLHKHPFTIVVDNLLREPR
jgi:acetyl-CoA carboxylase alpha subunit